MRRMQREIAVGFLTLFLGGDSLISKKRDILWKIELLLFLSLCSSSVAAGSVGGWRKKSTVVVRYYREERTTSVPIFLIFSPNRTVLYDVLNLLS